MAYLSNSFDFEHLQNSTNWEAVNKKRSFVARKMHKINKVSVVDFINLKISYTKKKTKNAVCASPYKHV